MVEQQFKTAPGISHLEPDAVNHRMLDPAEIQLDVVERATRKVKLEPLVIVERAPVTERYGFLKARVDEPRGDGDAGEQRESADCTEEHGVRCRGRNEERGRSHGS